MYTVYILLSVHSLKTYVGYTNNIERRLLEHNLTETAGFTLRYRPWTLIHKETYNNKIEAMQREKFLKTGIGRVEVKKLVIEYLNNN